MSSKPEPVVVLTALGRDQPGLIARFSSAVTELGGNITHVEQSAIQGMFSLFMVIEAADLPVGLDAYRFAYELTLRGKEFGLDVKAEVVDPSLIKAHAEKDLAVITIIGSDKRGVMAAFTGEIARHGCNIERMHHVARGDFMAFEIVTDVHGVDVETLRHDLRKVCEKVGVDAIIQPDSMFRARKRLVVFDMDSTIVDGEVIDELAKVAGVGDKVSEITARAMRGELDFTDALRERVRMLEGIPEKALGEIADSLQLTPGAEDLVTTLKGMGFKVALISGGFTYFTDHLKKELGFDYAYANRLVIRDGKVTGEVEGEIVDGARKAAIMRDLAEKEGLRPDEIVAIGDGANDQIMIKNAGLGIAFNAKEVLKKAADGSISKANIRGLLFCLGATDADLRRFAPTLSE